MNLQEEYWQANLAYMERNQTWNESLGVEAWKRILAHVDRNAIGSILELGCNIGRNLKLLSHESLLPNAKVSGLDINHTALQLCASRLTLQKAYHSSLLDVEVDDRYDLVFTSGVLIHIHPEHLKRAISKMVEFASRYILVCEYFNRTPIEIEYRGSTSLLWKRDFGKFIVEEFGLRCIDVGFLWGHVYDGAGFDDVTYWLFEK